MEIRNNTPSFGMAFRKPRPEDMERFTKYVVGAGPESLAKRGLARVIKKQANNAHFDMEYRPGEGIAVIPKSEAAQKYGFVEEVFSKDSKYSDTRSRFYATYTGEAYDKAYEAASKAKRALMTTKKVFAFMRTVGEAFIHPEMMLPKSLKTASRRAMTDEILVETRIAKDAKALAEKQKLESEIEAIFTPKNK